jgi:hypothetical protein
LGENPPDRFSVCIQGTGSQVVSGSLSIEIERKELENLLINGFFPSCSFADALQMKRSSGLRSMGLPYETEPSIIKHLAAFLQHALSGEPCRPNYLLFNGGSMKPSLFREAVLQNLQNWFDGTVIKELPSSSMDLSVSKGAAYFAKAKRGYGIRIGGGIPRSYYLAIDVCDAGGQVTQQALTVIPRGTQEGTQLESERLFMLKPNAPVVFHLLSSHTRLNDQAGDILDIQPEEMAALPPIRTVLRFGKQTQSREMVPVKLQVSLSEIGTLELWLQSQTTSHRWRLEFQLRSSSGEDDSLLALEGARSDVTYGDEELLPARELIETFFSSSSIPPGKLMSKLEGLIGQPRAEWPPTVLRFLFETILSQASRREISSEHESRWWNLAGFSLRPGFGYPLDDFRVKELWKVILGDLKQEKSLESQLQSWICYRRISGGLNKGQQTQLIGNHLNALLTAQKNAKKKLDVNEYAEKLRMIASMELVDLSVKIRLGDALVRRICEDKPLPCDYWALGRVGARHLLRGGIVNVVPAEQCATWIEKLLAAPSFSPNDESLFLMEQLARKTSFREVNLPESLIHIS